MRVYHIVSLEDPVLPTAQSDLEYTPRDTTHGLPKSQNRQVGRKDRDEDGRTQPRHEEHVRLPTTKAVLRPSIDGKAKQLSDQGRVRKSRLPRRSDGLRSIRTDNAEPLLELRLAEETVDL